MTARDSLTRLTTRTAVLMLLAAALAHGEDPFPERPTGPVSDVGPVLLTADELMPYKLEKESAYAWPYTGEGAGVLVRDAVIQQLAVGPERYILVTYCAFPTAGEALEGAEYYSTHMAGVFERGGPQGRTFGEKCWFGPTASGFGAVLFQQGRYCILISSPWSEQPEREAIVQIAARASAKVATALTGREQPPMGRLQAGTEGGPPDRDEFVLLSSLSAEEYRLGEPVLVTVMLKNVSQVEQKVRVLQPIGRWDWSLEIAPDDGPFERVEVRPRPPDVTLISHSVVAPGGSVSDVVGLWFCKQEIEGDPPWRSTLLFGEPGTFRYRITMRVGRVGEKSLERSTEGEIKVTDPADGFDRMVEGLERVVGNDAGLPAADFGNSPHLEKLASSLAGTPYASYVKWLRVRASVEQGREGWELIEEGGPPAARELAILQDYSEDLLADYQGSGLPPERAALIARGLAHLSREAALIELVENGLPGLQKYGWTNVLEGELQVMGYTGTLQDLSAAEALALAEQEGEKASRTVRTLGEKWPESSEVRQLSGLVAVSARDLQRIGR